MAIRSISRVQHRRGLRSDLPPKLYEGEIGWCLDTREIFIGNSEAFGGNSQILTQWTRNDQLIQHAYVGSTGVPQVSVPRSIGAKLDDMVSVRDYGAIGNGVADDGPAIQLAINELYGKESANGYSPLGGHVTIYLPAGTYRITSPLNIYPFVRLRGDGASRTRIWMDSDVAECVIRTTDDKGNTEANIGMDSAQTPVDIDLIDLWVDQTNPNGDAVRLQRSSKVRLIGLRITGPWQNSSNVQIDTSGIRIESLGTAYPTANIIVDDCEMMGMGHAVYSDDPIADLRIDLSTVRNCLNGVTLGLDAVLGGPARTRITSTTFVDLDGTAIGCYGTNLGVISMGNSFDEVGAFCGVNPIIWGPGTNGCASIGDQFGAQASPSIKNIRNDNPGSNVIFGPEQVSISTYQPALIGPHTLVDSNPVTYQPTTISYDATKFNSIYLDYTLVRGTDRRIGKLTILTDGINAILQDDSTTLGNDLGVLFDCSIISGIVTITYTTTATGTDAQLYFTETKWLI